MNKFKLIISGVFLLMLTACATKSTPGPDYYLLSSAELDSVALTIKPFKLAVGPIDVPVHLDREGIATLDGQNLLNYSDRHRWAEPLKENLTKILIADLAQLLPAQQLIDFPFRQANQPDYQLSVSIEKFGYVSTGSVILQARAVIINASGKQLDASYIKLAKSDVENNYPLIVKAMSDLLGEMALQLANKFSDKV